MIRFITGLLLVMGAMGGLEHENASIMTGMAIAALGLILMAWTVVDGTVSKYND
jgi:hypothetical protein